MQCSCPPLSSPDWFYWGQRRVKQESPTCSRWGTGPSQDAAGAGDGPVLLLLQLLLELFPSRPASACSLSLLAQLSHPLLRGHGEASLS